MYRLGVMEKVCVKHFFLKLLETKKCARGDSPSICQGLPFLAWTSKDAVCVNIWLHSRG